MNRDDIIRMAREAGISKPWDQEPVKWETLERFAALVISQHVNESRPNVSAEEAEWLQQIAYQHGGIGDLASHEFEFGAMVAAAEREACAKVCDAYDVAEDVCSSDTAEGIALAIRARGSNV